MKLSTRIRWRAAGSLADAMVCDLQQRIAAWCERKLQAAHESRHVRKQFLVVYTDASDRAKVRACGDVALITEEVAQERAAIRQAHTPIRGRKYSYREVQP
jgi:hypothetical protein